MDLGMIKEAMNVHSFVKKHALRVDDDRGRYTITLESYQLGVHSFTRDVSKHNHVWMI